MKVEGAQVQAMICNPWAYSPGHYGIPKSILFDKIQGLMGFLGRTKTGWDTRENWSANEDGLIRNALEAGMTDEQIFRRFRLCGNKKHWRIIIKRIRFIRKTRICAH